jgi:UDP-N-acetylglucosamine:LPS N-acetylglucosamine transferase
VQLLRVAEAFSGHEVVYVTVRPEYRLDVGGSRFFTVVDATRWNKLKLLFLALQVAWIVLRERPHVVFSTGAAPGFMALLCGKLCGAKTVWLDSIANVDELSLSGRKVKRWADLWLTQWPHLARPEGPLYAGAVL